MPDPATALLHPSSVSKVMNAIPLERPSSFLRRLTLLIVPNFSSRKLPISFSSALKLNPLTMTSLERLLGLDAAGLGAGVSC